jgi:hypothetical protein
MDLILNFDDFVNANFTIKTFGTKVQVFALLEKYEAEELEREEGQGYYLAELAKRTAAAFDACETIAHGMVITSSEQTNAFEIVLTDGTKFEYSWDGFYCLAYMLKITKNEQVIFDYNFGCVQQTETVDELINKINDDIDNNNAYGFFTIAFTWMLEKLNASS